MYQTIPATDSENMVKVCCYEIAGDCNVYLQSFYVLMR
jgi:hypothetical protein